MMADVKPRWTCPKCGSHNAKRIRDLPMYFGEFFVMCSDCNTFIQFEEEKVDSNNISGESGFGR